MCGIAGIWEPSASGNHDVRRSVALRMANALRHRGPDDHGCWEDADAGVAFSHRRLAVVDLSSLGHQPMLSASGRYVLVYNGEIYNFRNLRTELEKRNHAFRGHSDTEVILAAVTQWGVAEALRRFNGMFAFAVWDRQEQKLHLARDRFGEKPLYYGWFDGTFLFASELKAFRAHPRFAADVDRDALGLYMRHGYVPSPHCIYRGVKKLAAGALLTIGRGPADWDTHLLSYWSLAEAVVSAAARPFPGSDTEAVGEFERLLSDAVKLRLEADVPIGAFLSGGIDSSAIVALMQRHVALPVKTFTVGFEEASFDEAQHAKHVAQYLGTDHAELYVSATETLGVIPRLPTLYDEPFADSSQIPTFLIAALARRHVTVSLSGDGGDELLAGYNRYSLTSPLFQALLSTPLFARRAIGRGLRAVAPGTWDKVFGVLGRAVPGVAAQRHLGTKLHRFAGTIAGGNSDDSYMSLMSVWDQPSAVVLGVTEQADRIAACPPEAKHLSGLERMMLMDALNYLPDDILVKVDRASMGVSLETRVPFLDPRVAEFCWRLPPSMKVRQGRRKWLLRELLSRYVPRELVERPKTGFDVPIGSWLRGPLKNWAADLLAPDRLRAETFLDADRVGRVWASHLAGKEDWHGRLWCVLMFEAWLDQQRQPVAPRV